LCFYHINQIIFITKGIWQQPLEPENGNQAKILELPIQPIKKYEVDKNV